MGLPEPITYQNEPTPTWWSPWRRWLRRWGLLLVPLVLGIAALGIAVGTTISVLGASSTTAFMGAIAGALVATFGNLLVQYLLALMQQWRWERDRHYKEIAIATVLMTELGEAAVQMNINRQLLQLNNPAAASKVLEARSMLWDSIQLQAAEFWAPKTIFDLTTTYQAIRLINNEIRAKSARLAEADFHAAIGQTVDDIKSQAKKLERRLYRIGRE